MHYLSLCYHYIRPPKDQDPAPRILGVSEDMFRQHLNMLEKRFRFVSLDEVLAVSRGEKPWDSERTGMLITFDDGVADHLRTAQILAEHKISAAFFIPTCIIAEQRPANPIIIHYALAWYGLDLFLNAYRNALTTAGQDIFNLDIPFTRGIDNPWKTIASIKETFKYRLHHIAARSILLDIWDNLVLPGHPDAQQIAHLTPLQVKEIAALGHRLGTHSHSHISVASSSLTPDEFKTEVIQPRHILEKLTGNDIYAMSYPFGERKDCLKTGALLKQTRAYELAFTVEPGINSGDTSSWELGRYMPWGTETAEHLSNRIDVLMQKEPR